MDRGELFDILKRELPELRKRFGVKTLGVFGSFVRGTQNDSSDVDLLVEFSNPPGLKFVEFADYLEGLLNRKADVLTPAGLKSIRNARIVNDIEESVVNVEQA